MGGRGQRGASRPQPSGDIALKTLFLENYFSGYRRQSLRTSREVLFRSFCATSILMRYINAHIPHHPTLLLLLILILLPAWTHEGRKSGEAYLKEKQESPWGSRIKKGKERNGRERGWEWGWGGGFRMEADLDGEPKTRSRRMNIDNILSVGK